MLFKKVNEVFLSTTFLFSLAVDCRARQGVASVTSLRLLKAGINAVKHVSDCTLVFAWRLVSWQCQRILPRKPVLTLTFGIHRMMFSIF